MDVSKSREHHSTVHQGQWELLHRPEGWATWPPLPRPAPERDPPQEVLGWICTAEGDPSAQKDGAPPSPGPLEDGEMWDLLGGDHKSKGDVTKTC